MDLKTDEEIAQQVLQVFMQLTHLNLLFSSSYISCHKHVNNLLAVIQVNHRIPV
jgi:hypothetical protein